MRQPVIRLDGSIAAGGRSGESSTAIAAEAAADWQDVQGTMMMCRVGARAVPTLIGSKSTVVRKGLTTIRQKSEGAERSPSKPRRFD